VLAKALTMHGPTYLGRLFGTNPHTVQWHALEYGLVEPGHPVYVEYQAEDGTIHRYYTSSTAPMSNIPDDELDNILGQILDVFPDFGHRMITGHLHYLGL